MKRQKRFHEIVTQTTSVSSSQTVQINLPTNAISCLYLNVKPLNETSSILNYIQSPRLLESAVSAVRVYYQGMGLLRMSAIDIMMLNYHRFGILPRSGNDENTDNARRSVCLPILFGNYLLDETCGIPQSRPGQAQIEIDFVASGTGFDGLTFSLESDSMLGVNPSYIERKVTIPATASTTGDQTTLLPTGNDYRGLLAVSPTGFSGATPAPTLSRLELRTDGVEQVISATDFEVFQMLSQMLGRQPFAYDGHKHIFDGTAGAGSATSRSYDSGSGGGGSTMIHNTGYLDFDPTMSGETLPTSDINQLVARWSCGTTGTVRFTPVEVLPAPK